MLFERKKITSIHWRVHIHLRELFHVHGITLELFMSASHKLEMVRLLHYGLICSNAIDVLEKYSRKCDLLIKNKK